VKSITRCSSADRYEAMVRRTISTP
jgi:hypothetical protein